MNLSFLPYKRTWKESNKPYCCSNNSYFSTTKQVCEYADYWGAEEDHSHRQRAHPCCKIKKKNKDNILETKWFQLSVNICFHLGFYVAELKLGSNWVTILKTCNYILKCIYLTC